MKTIAGPPQAWFVEPHDSMASIEKLQNDTDKMTSLVFTSIDPDFWTPKPKPAATSAVTPADKKPEANNE